MQTPRFRAVPTQDGHHVVVNYRDWCFPSRVVASFAPHPHDPNEAGIIAEICAEALNRELPGLTAGAPATEGRPTAKPKGQSPEPESQGQESEERAIRELPLQEEEVRTAAPAVGQDAPAASATGRERKPLPEGWDRLKGRDKVGALCASLFND